ncbi:MAG: hypothetical protein M1829_006330 [Trizodia sp. TS-e1964]|nr:MAG: hypothetical protein M1829_006330 [Trizodia sp. TS-e1964]
MKVFSIYRFHALWSANLAVMIPRLDLLWIQKLREENNKLHKKLVCSEKKYATLIDQLVTRVQALESSLEKTVCSASTASQAAEAVAASCQESQAFLEKKLEGYQSQSTNTAILQSQTQASLEAKLETYKSHAEESASIIYSKIQSHFGTKLEDYKVQAAEDASISLSRIKFLEEKLGEYKTQVDESAAATSKCQASLENQIKEYKEQAAETASLQCSLGKELKQYVSRAANTEATQDRNQASFNSRLENYRAHAEGAAALVQVELQVLFDSKLESFKAQLAEQAALEAQPQMSLCAKLEEYKTLSVESNALSCRSQAYLESEMKKQQNQSLLSNQKLENMMHHLSDGIVDIRQRVKGLESKQVEVLTGEDIRTSCHYRNDQPGNNSTEKTLSNPLQTIEPHLIHFRSNQSTRSPHSSLHELSKQAFPSANASSVPLTTSKRPFPEGDYDDDDLMLAHPDESPSRSQSHAQPPLSQQPSPPSPPTVRPFRPTRSNKRRAPPKPAIAPTSLKEPSKRRGPAYWHRKPVGEGELVNEIGVVVSTADVDARPNTRAKARLLGGRKM